MKIVLISLGILAGIVCISAIITFLAEKIVDFICSLDDDDEYPYNC